MSSKRARSTGRRDDAVARIRRLIEHGELAPGMRLPGERQLADRLKMSRGTVREALQFLGAMGLVATRRGGGSFVRAAPGDAHELRPGWHAWVDRHRRHILEILEAREACEAFAAELAARRIGPDHLEQMVDALRRMAEATAAKDITGLVQADLRFHDALLRASGNASLRKMAGALGERLVPERAATWDLPGRAERSHVEHQAIYEAVRSGDPTGAAQAARQHLRSVRDDIVTHLMTSPAEPERKPRRALRSRRGEQSNVSLPARRVIR